MENHNGTASLSYPSDVMGARLRFRRVKISDAAFILSLRLDPSKNSYISATSDDLEAQENYIRNLPEQGDLYFIIEHEGVPVGTVRLYDQIGDSFCWGSWILSKDAPTSSAVESTLMVYSLALHLGFQKSHFEVRRGNEKVWQYHERMGARRTSETEHDYHYAMDRESILAALEKYQSRLPDGVKIA